MTDGQALDSVFDELAVLGHVLGTRLGPLAVMPRVEGVALGGGGRRGRPAITSCLEQGEQPLFDLGVVRHRHQQLVGLDPLLGPPVHRKEV